MPSFSLGHSPFQHDDYRWLASPFLTLLCKAGFDANNGNELTSLSLPAIN